jgi:ubiquitin-activating enzyme E1
LAGPKQVVLCDNEIVKISELGSNFYLREDHVGKVTRAEAVLEQLSNLNPGVDVKISKTHDIGYLSSSFECVVITDHYDSPYLVALNKACRANNVGFIYSGNLGLYGFGFVDFGDKQVVHDTNGEANRSAVIVGITHDAEGLVYSHEDKRHGFEDGDYVTFKEVKGMSQVNGKQFKITFKSPHCFAIGDTTGFSPYESNGIAEQVKVPVLMEFKGLE